MAVIETKQVINARDLGGMSTTDGYLLKNRKLLRSAELNDASPEDLCLLTQKYQLGHCIDLRATHEHALSPDPELIGVGQVHLPLLAANTLGVAIKDNNWTDMLRGRWLPDVTDVCDIYAKLVSPPTYDTWRRIFHMLRNTNKRALLIHCTNGKDRTGVVVAVILLALGVSKEDAMADYLESNRWLAGRRKEIYDNAALNRSQVGMQDRVGALLEAKPEYLQAALDRIVADHGDIRSFLDDVCGIRQDGIEHLKTLYLQ